MRTSTTEAQRHREESGGRMIARDRVIGDAASICHSERAQVEPSETRASRRIPARPMLGNAASGSSHETGFIFGRRIHQTWMLVRAALREIFDESAYDRFLLRTNAGRSVASYRDYMRERDAAMVKKPRCC